MRNIWIIKQIYESKKKSEIEEEGAISRYSSDLLDVISNHYLDESSYDEEMLVIVLWLLKLILSRRKRERTISSLVKDE